MVTAARLHGKLRRCTQGNSPRLDSHRTSPNEDVGSRHAITAIALTLGTRVNGSVGFCDEKAVWFETMR